MSECIINKNLLRIVKLKMCANNIDNLEQIEDISIQDINLMENRLDIDLAEISKLKNLKFLSLKYFEITDKIIETINELKFLEEIEFSMCIFKSNKELGNKLKSVIIYSCQDFDICTLRNNKLLEELQFIHSGILDIAKVNTFKKLRYIKIAHCSAINIPNISTLENLEQIYLNHIEIPYNIDISEMKKLESISLNGSSVPNKELYIKNLKSQNEKLQITFEENDLPID